ncbi:MAG: pyridoxamine 5'-phosphate oxidase family protein [Sandarakinorhabdus sp.]|nr:pyridoxamine 5'-phosphate oxidase family protein [Sandarakinorhabdus sp.]
MTAEFPWHAGEIALQTRVGVADRMAVFGRRVIRDFMPDQHRSFYAQLPFLVAGSVDPAGDVWATVLAGAPGFAASPDPRVLTVAAVRAPDDPADVGMNDGDAIGLLGIELHSRRRNRVNGRIRRSTDMGFSVGVEHAFGNCPRYIQLRSCQPAPVATPPGAVQRSDRIDAAAAALIARADTFFVASFFDDENGRQVDVSHRGGKPGFVRMDADGGLTIPDFAGNLHFNTLGNFHSNPRGGLVFVDFETGDTLHLAGNVELVFDSAEIAAFQGAERLWRFRPRRVVMRPAALPIRWSFEAAPPNSMMTGSRDAAADRLAKTSSAP